MISVNTNYIKLKHQMQSVLIFESNAGGGKFIKILKDIQNFDTCDIGSIFLQWWPLQYRKAKKNEMPHTCHSGQRAGLPPL
jgi:hypothetical protein